MDIGKTIRKSREKLGISQKDLAKALGITPARLSNWELGINRPDADMIGIISKELSISANDLLGLHIVHDPMPSASEMEIVKKYRTLDAYGKETVSIILDREYVRAGAAISQQKPEPAAEAQRATLTIDYYRLPVSAGTGTIDPGDGYHDTLEVLANRYTVASDYVVRVQGDSMMPRFLDGDLLLVHKTDVVDFGEVGVFSVDGKSFIKQAGCGELISLNRECPPIPLTSAAVYPQGRIIGVLDPAWIVH
nr:MAG TPA: Repressor protein CI [Caudoviricetes sp.]